PTEQRVAALQLLGSIRTGSPRDLEMLTGLLASGNPQPVQQAALGHLAEWRGAEVPASVLRSWNSYAPSVRGPLLDLLLRREEWVAGLLDQVAGEKLPASDLGASARQRLLSHPSKALRERAQRLLPQPINVERQKIIDEYLPAVRQATGRPGAGAELFTKHCAVCHPLGQSGTGAAPDLASVVDRSPERMLIAILDPNRAVEDRYLNYLVRTKAGDEYSGLLAGETANNITLISASGAKEVLFRSEIASLNSTRLSLMPEGFEQFLKPPDLADLLAYIESAASPARLFPGNRPALVKPDAAGALRLQSVNAELHGDGIAFEAHYRNIGSWSDTRARAVWTLQVPAGGSYEVWLHWACHEHEAGHRFRFQIGDASLVAAVPSTLTWDRYEARRFGRMQLPAGQWRAVFQAEPPLPGYLIDLLEVRLVPASANPPSFDSIGSDLGRPGPAGKGS
ncbi:MAG TPA: c-type cytochrome, partial [Candidatus Dormibacteraeota bacterium]|nr:c-type cytochrome [Candidatus Dormibacteraeota bacterium]